MRASDAKVAFGEWLPDLDDTDCPGITEAQNVLPIDKGYQGLLGLTTYSAALAATPVGAIAAVSPLTSAGLIDVHAGTATKIYALEGGGSFNDRTGAAISAVTQCQFAQYGNNVIWTSYENFPRFRAMGGTSNFATLASTGTAPKARRIGVIGQFVILANTTGGAAGAGQNHLQWSGIDDETDWSTPGTSAAVTVQAGEQFLPPQFGAINGIASGDQHGLVFQESGITRMTYVGGPIVFQFDSISRNIGCFYPNSIVQVGELTYFISRKGFYVTDGVNVTPIGAGKVDKYFFANLNSSGSQYAVTGAVDVANKLIYWNYPSSGTTPDRLLIFNYEEGRWTRGILSTYALFSSAAGTLSSSATLLNAFDSSFRACWFTGAFVSNAVITGPEAELNPGLLTFVQGVKPLSDGNAPTVALGTRDALTSAVSYSSDASITAATGYADFRSSARFHRPRFTWSSDPGRIAGYEFQAIQAGAR